MLVPHQRRSCLLSVADRRLLSRFLSNEKVKVGGIRYLPEITPEVRRHLLPARNQDQHGWHHSPTRLHKKLSARIDRRIIEQPRLGGTSTDRLLQHFVGKGA